MNSSPGCTYRLSFLRHFVFGIVLATFNFVTTLLNVKYLSDSGHGMYAGVSLSLLWTPGIVTSLGFLVLYARGNKAVNKLQLWKLVLYPIVLFLFYPIIPIILTLGYLITRNEVVYEKATLAKFFAGFLDHGPHFVLRLVIVVLVGGTQGGVYTRTDTVFILSMVSSFLSFILTALWFNERDTSWGRWFFLSGPMYCAVFACRSFTLAVVLKETLGGHSYHELVATIVPSLMFLVNLGLFRYCGQDWTRSAVFGVASLLLPVGYNNDPIYYQVPRQDILQDHSDCQIVPHQTKGNEEIEFQPQDGGDTIAHPTKLLVPMKSAKFLFLHTVANTCLIGGCAAYLLLIRGGTMDGDRDALVIPQLLGVIPGTMFASGTCLLMSGSQYRGSTQERTRCQSVCRFLSRGSRSILAGLLSIGGFLSLLPALLWTFLYKWFTQEDLKQAILADILDERALQ